MISVAVLKRGQMKNDSEGGMVSRNGVLLVGGAGFIGTALARNLVSAGKDVHILARKDPQWTDGVGQVHVGDFAHLEKIEEVISRCATIVHLASSTTPGSSAYHPGQERENLVSTLEALEFLQRKAGMHIVFLSSGGTVYGNPDALPVDENSPLRPVSYHGAGKVALEAFWNVFRAAGHAVTVLRPSNAYGPGQFPDQGFGLVHAALEHARLGKPIEIWGDGKNERDFVYIDDLVEAIVAVVGRPGDSETYNIGSGVGYSLSQVVAMAERITGRTIQIKYRPARAGDVRRVVLDSSLFQRAFSWQPKVSLEEGMKRTWEWLTRTGQEGRARHGP